MLPTSDTQMSHLSTFDSPSLGIWRASSLALPAFLASAASTLRLQTLILTSILVTPDAHAESMTSEWRSKTEFNDADSLPTHQQALWDKPLLKQTVKTLFLSTVDPYNTVRLKAVSSPHAGDWLNALPVTACRLRLDDENVRIAVGLRLGGRNIQTTHIFLWSPNRRHRRPRLVMLSWLRSNSSS